MAEEAVLSVGDRKGQKEEAEVRKGVEPRQTGSWEQRRMQFRKRPKRW